MATAAENRAEIEAKAQALVKSAGADSEVVVENIDGSVSALVPLSEVIRELGTEPEAVLKVDDILDKCIAIIGAEVCDGDYGKFLFITYRDEQGCLLAFTTGATIVMRKLLAIKQAGRFPVTATISKQDDYYIIT